MKTSYINERELGANSIIQQSFGWMFGGLLVTALTSVFAAGSYAFQQALHTNPILFFGLIIAEFALVIGISSTFTRVSQATAIAMFLGYAALNGLTLSTIFLIYAGGTIASAFVSASCLFGAMALYGFATKKDLTSVGNIAFMALLGLIIASVVNMFLHSSGLGYLLSFGAVAIFTALTAYDTQKLKVMSQTMSGSNLGIYGALALYLDFINIFLALLRIMGGRRN